MTIYLRGEEMKTDERYVLGAGFLCIDIIQRQERREIALGGTAANVLSILSKLGRQTVFASADYDNAWGKWLKAALNARNIDVYSFSKSRTAAPRVLEILDEHTREHYFQTVCPVCGRNLSKVILPDRVHVKNSLTEHIRRANVFYYDRISPGIREIAARNQTGWNFYEPNACRSYRVFLDSLREVNILKFSQSRVPQAYTERLIDDLRSSEVQLVIVTMGVGGFRFSFRETDGRLSKWIEVPSQRVENMVDDSGAGDWLTAVFLHYFLERYPVYSDGLDREALLEMLNAAKEIASLKCSFIGAQGIFQDRDGLEMLSRRLDAEVTPVSDVALDWGEGCPCCGRRSNG